jgi:predicted DNA repair protein MutK
VASSLLALLDDIATVLDDVAVMTKVATKKTAGVLGDDLALNAQQVSGVDPDRELPVVWAVAKGSMLNKAILVPAALLLSAFLPGAVVPLMMIGGAFLCFEGVEKLAHKWLHSRAEDDAHHAELTQALADPNVDLVALERDKIKGAIRTDFILSAEIIVISLGTVASKEFSVQVGVLVATAIVMTVGVLCRASASSRARASARSAASSQRSARQASHCARGRSAAASNRLRTRCQRCGSMRSAPGANAR